MSKGSSRSPDSLSPLARAEQEGIPAAFCERLAQILSAADCEAAVASFHAPRRIGFRLNSLSRSAQDTLVELRTKGLDPVPVPWLAGAYTVPASQRESLVSSEAFEEGRVYVQNLSSMVPPVVLDVQPGEEVLDLTAAPGSKTHQMACAMQNRGRITAVESVRARYYKLKDNMERLGADCVRPFFQDGTLTWRYRPEFFDRVLLDAPCSSEGRFRTDRPETTRYWSTRKVTEMSRKQRRLLYSAIRCLKPGGTLVYSTCSFSPEENEVVIQKMLAKFAGAIEISPIGLDIPQFREGLTEWKGRAFDTSLSMARRIVPDAAMDGFFVCRLEKGASTLD